jgi:hypothetical protein
MAGVDNFHFANYEHALGVLRSVPSEHAACTRPARGVRQALAIRARTCAGLFIRYRPYVWVAVLIRMSASSSALNETFMNLSLRSKVPLQKVIVA